VTQTQLLTASVIREVTAANDPARADLYRLSLTCRAETGEGEMRVAWAPGSPNASQEISAVVDRKTARTYKNDGHETMGNTGTGNSGPGDIVLRATPLPDQTLTVSNLVGGETVVFPFAGLSQQARKALSACFAKQR
jgi:hypothetical protein